MANLNLDNNYGREGDFSSPILEPEARNFIE
jgi:hypothetical protein